MPCSPSCAACRSGGQHGVRRSPERLRAPQRPNLMRARLFAGLARLLAILGLTLLATVGLPASTACACSCATPSAGELIDSVDAIFEGTVTEATDPQGHAKTVRSDRPVILTLAVSKVYKGEVHATTQVTTAAESGSCGYPLPVGSAPTLFARLDANGGLTIAACDQVANVAEVSGLLPDGRAPLPGADAAAAPEVGDKASLSYAESALLLTGLAAVAAVAVLALRRRASNGRGRA